MPSGVEAARVPIAVQVVLLLRVSAQMSVEERLFGSPTSSRGWSLEGHDVVALSIGQVLKLPPVHIQIEILKLERVYPRGVRRLVDELDSTWKLRMVVVPNLSASPSDEDRLADVVLTALLGERGLAFALSEALAVQGLSADGLRVEALDQRSAAVVENYAMPLPRWLSGEWSVCDASCTPQHRRHRDVICPLGSSAACELVDGPQPVLHAVCDTVCDGNGSNAGFVAAVMAASACSCCSLALVCAWCFRKCRPKDEGTISIQELHGISASYRVVRPTTEASKSGTLAKAYAWGVSSRADVPEGKVDLEMGMGSKKVRVIWDFDASQASKYIGSQGVDLEISANVSQRDSGTLRMMADKSVADSKQSGSLVHPILDGESLGVLTTTTALPTTDPCAFNGSWENDEVVCHATVSADEAATAKLAYVAGDRVEYFSKTHHRWLPATVSKTMPLPATSGSPLRIVYDVKIGPSGQLRRDVVLDELRLPLCPSETVERHEAGAWRPARLASTQRAGFTTFGYAVLPSNCDEASSGAEIVPAAEIRRRFVVGEAVEIYQGPELGWLSGCVGDVSSSGSEAVADHLQLRVLLSEPQREDDAELLVPAHLARRRVREGVTPAPTGGFESEEHFCSHL